MAVFRLSILSVPKASPYLVHIHNNSQNCSLRRTFTSQSSRLTSYGFIGLGRMGYPMAGNIRKKIQQNESLIVYDVNGDVSKQLASEHAGVDVAKNVREVAEQSYETKLAANADIIVTALPEPQHVKAVYEAMLDSSTQSTSSSARLFIDTSTIDPMTSSDVAKKVQSNGRDKFVDAPMSGGVVGASAGSLTFMVGAEEEDVERVKEVLSMMGKRTIHLGPQTSGLKGKLANNYLLALNNVATCEAMNMGVKWGLDAHKLADMINTATGKCWPSEINNPVPGVIPAAPASRGYEGGFGTSLMLKDLRLALKAAAEADVVPQLGQHAERIYTAVSTDEKCKGKDFSVVYRYIGGKE